MRKYNVAILGATGAVGREMMKILEERDFPIDELRLLASARSVGTVLIYKGKEIIVQEAKATSFESMDFVLGAVGNETAKHFAPYITQSKTVFIDNSSAFRMNEEVPLVVPEINPADALTHHGIIANPNCSTIISLVAVNALNRLSPIQSMVVSTYQAVSGAGHEGITELEEQMREVIDQKPATMKVFPTQIAYNVIPFIGSILDNGYTSEEMKIQNEGRKIMHLPNLVVSCTCVRVPVIRSHSISINVKTAETISVDQAETAIQSSAGCRMSIDVHGRNYPTPLDTSDQDLVWVGRIRKDLTDERGLNLWCCGDQIRKGAATNAVQIAELLLETRK